MKCLEHGPRHKWEDIKNNVTPSLSDDKVGWDCRMVFHTNKFTRVFIAKKTIEDVILDGKFQFYDKVLEDKISNYTNKMNTIFSYFNQLQGGPVTDLSEN